MPADALHRIVYSYLESGIPVVLGFDHPVNGGHAVTLVGHSLTETIASKTEEGRIREASDFVPRFLVQDDARGPFRSVRFLDPSSAASDSEVGKRWASVKKGRTQEKILCVFDKEEIGFFRGAVIPLPPRILLSADLVVKRAHALTEHRFVQSLGKSASNVKTRTFLRLSERLRADCRRMKLPDRVARALESHTMPKWVWVTEVAEAPFDGERVSGLILFDAAGHPFGGIGDDLVAYALPDETGKHFEVALPGAREGAKSILKNLGAFASFGRFERDRSTRKPPQKEHLPPAGAAAGRGPGLS